MKQPCNHLKEMRTLNNLVDIDIRPRGSMWTMTVSDYESDKSEFYVRYCPLCGKDLYEVEEEPQ